MNEYIIQGIGFLGVLLFIISYQLKSNMALFLCQLLGCLVFFVQFMIMGAYTGAFGLVINILRNVLLLKSDKWKWVTSRWTLSTVLLLLTVMTWATWAGWISLLPFVSVGVTTIGYWTHNGQKIRASQLVGSPCTMLYDILIRSWGGALSEGITIVSILVSIYRFGWKELGEKTD